MKRTTAIDTLFIQDDKSKRKNKLDRDLNRDKNKKRDMTSNDEFADDCDLVYHKKRRR